jgi:hypothetical protein
METSIVLHLFLESKSKVSCIADFSTLQTPTSGVKLQFKSRPEALLEPVDPDAAHEAKAFYRPNPNQVTDRLSSAFHRVLMEEEERKNGTPLSTSSCQPASSST